MKQIEEYVRSIPDFPEKGIIFRDITTVLGDAEGFHLAIDKYQELLKDMDFDVIAGLESRGFMFGCPVAYNMGKAFVPIRKKGKLPCKTISEEYAAGIWHSRDRNSCGCHSERAESCNRR